MTALVPLNPHAGPPAPVVVLLDRGAILERLEELSIDALMQGNTALAYILDRVVIACRGARGCEMAVEMLLFLEREQLLEVVYERDGSVRPRDFLDDLSPTGVLTIIHDEVSS